MKGSRLSLSADDLIINGIRQNKTNPLSQKKNKSIWYLYKSKEAEDKDGSPFRERAYTSTFWIMKKNNGNSDVNKLR